MPKPKRSRPSYGGSGRRADKLEDVAAIPAAAFCRAYEADLHRGNPPSPELLRWAGEGSDIWADRYDIVHLLNELPESVWRTTSSSSLSSSWSLPSDAQDTFDLSSDEELAEYARNRRQSWVDGLREARLREREREDEEEQTKRDETAKEVENEQPPPDILNLMQHTARSLAASPNATVLEMRIMARHSTDERFAFLRPGGRWSIEWEKQRASATTSAQRHAEAARMPRTGTTHATAPPVSSGALGSLVGGYDSDSDSDMSHSRHTLTPPPQPAEPPPPPPPGSPPPSPPPIAPHTCEQVGPGNL